MSERRSVFISGASSGFGRESAWRLAEKGHDVFATMRGGEDKNAAAAQEHSQKAIMAHFGWE